MRSFAFCKKNARYYWHLQCVTIMNNYYFIFSYKIFFLFTGCIRVRPPLAKKSAKEMQSIADICNTWQ
ncbi:MAG: hypothetical protein DBX55_01905 [Verrucomicrobia bacterium]|nr:MAG: hypothetical protein DBX55_01905 [Verrucomicrobiota bacterium]